MTSDLKKIIVMFALPVTVCEVFTIDLFSFLIVCFATLLVLVYYRIVE